MEHGRLSEQVASSWVSMRRIPTSTQYEKLAARDIGVYETSGISVDTTAPSRPTNVRAVAEVGKVRLTWKPSPESDTAIYVVYRAASSNGPFAIIATIAATPNPLYEDSPPASDSTVFFYKVAARDATGNTSALSASTAVYVTVAAANLDNAIAGPNPWVGSTDPPIITIDRITAKSKVKIYTVAGTLVRSLDEKDGKADWDVKDESGADAPAGIYVFVIRDEKRKKILKNAVVR